LYPRAPHGCCTEDNGDVAGRRPPSATRIGECANHDHTVSVNRSVDGSERQTNVRAQPTSQIGKPAARVQFDSPAPIHQCRRADDHIYLDLADRYAYWRRSQVRNRVLCTGPSFPVPIDSQIREGSPAVRNSSALAAKSTRMSTPTDKVVRPLTCSRLPIEGSDQKPASRPAFRAFVRSQSRRHFMTGLMPAVFHQGCLSPVLSRARVHPADPDYF
jgi:hypothetical protein